MNVGVIGAGWAGLAAAISLHDAGHAVTIHEASGTLGGRARSVRRPEFAVPLDNGQHILLGAYSSTLGLMKRLGLDTDAAFARQPLALKTADNVFELRCRALPSPWHAAAGVLLARGWKLPEKLALTRTIMRLKAMRWAVVPDQTVAHWLAHNDQSAGVIHRFWEPLCLAALNTPLRDASINLLAKVLGDSLDAGRHASDVLIPVTDLSDLWANHIPKDITVQRRSAIRKIAREGNGYRLDDTHVYDALVVATAPASAYRLLANLPQGPQTAALLESLAAFEPIPIATLTLSLETPWHSLPDGMLMLDDRAHPGALGQWLFNHARIACTPERQRMVCVVISDCRALMALERDTAVKQLTAQVRAQTACAGTLPHVRRHALIIEKRATFAATPGLTRPDNCTPWNNLWVAGDWTDTGYPAVLEGAVRSGQRAAALISQGCEPEPWSR
ncbi:MAG: hydroxysqualene dehydroxylase HpnE [Pusillimonas sp.]